MMGEVEIPAGPTPTFVEAEVNLDGYVYLTLIYPTEPKGRQKPTALVEETARTHSLDNFIP